MDSNLIENFKLYLDRCNIGAEEEYKTDNISNFSLFTTYADEFKDFIKSNASYDVYQALFADGQIDGSEIASLKMSDSGKIESINENGEFSQEDMEALEIINSQENGYNSDIEADIPEEELEDIDVETEDELTGELTDIPDDETTNPDTEVETGIDTEPDTEPDTILDDETENPDAPPSIQDIIQMELTLEEKLEAAYENEIVMGIIDTDKDETLSDEEKEAFIDFIKEKYEVDELDLETLEKALKDIEEDNFNYGELSGSEDSKEEKVEDKVEEQQPVNNTQNAQVQNQTPQVSGGSRTSSSGASGSSGRTPSSYAKETNVKKEATLEELKSQKTQKETELKTLQNEMKSVNSGEDSAVQSAQKEYDEKEEAYEKAVEEDSKLDNLEFNGMPVKQAVSENLTAIDETQKNIDDTTNRLNEVNNNITSKNSQISSTKSKIAALEDAVKSYNNVDSENSGKVKDKKEAAQRALDEAKEQLETQEGELADLNTQKEQTQGTLDGLKSDLETLNATKAQIDEFINQNASTATKEALEAFNNAKENLQTVKEQRTKEIQGKIDTKQTEINELDKQIQAKEQESIKKEYGNSSVVDDMNLEFCLSDKQLAELEKVKGIYKDNEELYKSIAKQVLADTGKEIPPEVICAIHYRESDCNFNTYLHNGDPLGSPTVHVPAGVYFDDFESAAADAIEREIDSTYYGKCNELGVESDFSTLSSVLLFAERYNGFGYRNNGCQSLYVYEGTTEYTGGRYAGDGNWRPGEWPPYPKPGVAVITKTLMELS